MSVNYHDGIIILWGCISSAWTGKLARAESNMDGTKDMVILSPHHPYPCCQSYTGWFKTKNLNVLEQPSQSPDLNPIKTLWKDLKIAVYQQYPSSLTRLEQFWQEEWAKKKRNDQDMQS